jgi:serine/threonine protein kinase
MINSPDDQELSRQHALSGYKKIRRLGSGSFGEVWLGQAPGGVKVAIKVIFRALEDEETHRELKALELIRGLHHPFLLQTQAYWIEDNRLYIVMELAEGTLRDRAKKCKDAGLPGIPLPELLKYFQQAAEALDYLHQHAVLHRNVSPDNILLVAGNAKLADFGLARLKERDQSFATTSTGTPAYMAPEVWRGRFGPHSDQYSLAAAFVALCLDRPLFPGKDMLQHMAAALETAPDLTPLPLNVQEVLLKALSKTPAERYGSCVEFYQALEEAWLPELPTMPRSGKRPIPVTLPSPPWSIPDTGVERPTPGQDTIRPGQTLDRPPSDESRLTFPSARRPSGRDERLPAPSPSRPWRVRAMVVIFLLALAGAGLCFMTVGRDGRPGGPIGHLLPVWLIIAPGAIALLVFLLGLLSRSAQRTGVAGPKRAASLEAIPPPPRRESPFIEAEAPYVVGRPVQGELFVGRSDILKMVRDNLSTGAAKNVLVLRGQRRTGKSSVLLHLRDTLAQESEGFYLPVFVDVQGMTMVENEGQFLHFLAHQIWSGLETHDVKEPRPVAADFAQAPLIAFELDFLQGVKTALGPRQILLMLDEFEMVKSLIDHGRVSAKILDYFRHLMQHSPLLFLIAGTQKLRELTGGYWSVFFNLAVPIDIGTLKEAEARWLITEPVRRWYTVELPAIQEIVRVAGCHPYFTQLVCKQLLEVRNECRVNRVTLAHASEAIDRALQSGDEQIGYPWTEEDCSPAERLVLAALTQERGDGTPVASGSIRRRLEDASIAIAVGEATNRLQARGVLRVDD